MKKENGPLFYSALLVGQPRMIVALSFKRKGGVEGGPVGACR